MKIGTAPNGDGGQIYRWTLKHVSLNGSNIDGMNVLIGNEDNLEVQQVTRISNNGQTMDITRDEIVDNNQIGWTGTVISTPSGYEKNWETYAGYYEVL